MNRDSHFKRFKLQPHLFPYVFSGLTILGFLTGDPVAAAEDFAPLMGLPRGTPVLIAAGRLQAVQHDLTNAVAIDANARYWMALRADGTVVRGGELADDSLTGSLSNIVAISAGGAHSLAIRSDGKLFAWVAQGNAFQDQILPIPPGLSNATQIAAGYTHSVVLDGQGRLFAWGANTHGPFDPPAWATNVIGLTAGQLYSAVLLADGTVRGWDVSGTPVGDPPLAHKPSIQVDAGVFGHALSLRADGRVFAWGNNSHGQARVPTEALTDVVRVAAGGIHSVALKKNGTALSWGDNEYGQRDIPADVKFLGVAAGNYSTLGLTRAPVIEGQTTPDQAGAGEDVTVEVAVACSDSYLTYWYSGERLLATTSTPRLELTNVQPATGPWFRVVVSNEFGWTGSEWVRLAVYDRPVRITRQPADLAIVPGGSARFEVEARGSDPINWQWQFEGVDIPGATGPVLELAKPASVATGAYRAVARNGFGETTSEPAFLSVGLPVIAEQPLSLYQRPGFPTRLTVRAVSPEALDYQWLRNGEPLEGGKGSQLNLGPAGAAVEGAYRVVLSNSYGALTSAVANVRLYSPPSHADLPALAVAIGLDLGGNKDIPIDLTNALAVAGGDTHGLALRSDGALVGWGKPSNGGDWVPANIPADATPVAAIAVGRGHNVALRPDGTVRTWGATYGQPEGLSEVVAVSAGAGGFSMALRKDGSVTQWPDPSNLPGGLTNVIAVACGTGSSMCLQADGTIIEWVDYLQPRRQRFQNPQPIAIAVSEWGRWCLLDSGEVLAWNNSDQPPHALVGVTNAIALTSDSTWGGAYCLLSNGRVFSEESGLLAGLEHATGIAGSQRCLFALTRAPFVDVSPAGTNVAPGGRLVLRVSARSSTPLRYQWKRDDVELPGATGSEFIQESVSAFDLGNYVVRLSNAEYSVVTPSIRVWVTGPVEFRLLPDQTRTAGTDLTASPEWAGEGPVTFQWEREGVAMPGATNAALNIANIQAPDAGVYRLRATNPYGTSISGGFRLTVLPSVPRLTVVPQDMVVPAGTEVVLGAQARGSEPFSWQWYLNDTAISGGSNATLRLANVQTGDAGKYEVEVRNSVGAIRSPSSVLTVEPSAPLAMGGEGLRLVLEGNTAVLERPFLGSEPISWQWRRGGTDLLGATNRTLNLPAVQTSDANSYTVVARNDLGMAESAPVHLTVLPAAGDGTVVGWGSLSPPPGLTAVVSLDGGLSYGLALRRDGTVVRFGRESTKELDPPEDLNHVVRIAAGTSHACALRENGQLVAWGFPIPAVTDVPRNAGPMVDVAAGTAFTLGLRPDGTVIAWGSESGDYGAGPLLVPPEATNVVAIAAARDSAVALRADGSTVWMGRTPSVLRAVPAAATNLMAIDVGTSHAAAIRRDGKVLVWGSGTAIRPVPAMPKVTRLAAGFTHTLILGADGSVAAFGDRTLGKTNVPPGLSNVVAIAAGSDFSFAVTRTPVVLTNPAPTDVVEGSAAQMTVAAVGPGQLRYLWFREGQALPGQTSATMSLNSARPGDTGRYRVTISNEWGSVTSASAWLTVLALPTITLEPVDVAIPAGTNLTLTVGVDGAPPLSVQWRFAGANLKAGTNLTLNLANVQFDRAGGYDVVVTSPYGSATSRIAQVSVLPSAPGFMSPPKSVSVLAGLPARLESVVYGSEPLTFIWRRGAFEVARTLSPELVISDPQAADAGTYTLTVVNGLGQAVSPVVNLTVTPSAPRVARQPADVVGRLGEPLELSVEFQGTRPMRLQWFQDGTAITDATENVFRVAVAHPADQGSYICQASNALGQVDSRTAAMAVDPPAILLDLEDRSVAEGDDVIFTVRASGSEPRVLVWTHDGAAVSSGAAERLFLPAVRQADAGAYRVVVSNATGAVSSRLAQLKVSDAAAHIVRMPAGMSVLERSLALLNVDARGTQPIGYRWFRDGVALPGATNSWLLFRRSRPEDAGVYTVQVSNRLGIQVSDLASLAVIPALPGQVVSWGPVDWARPAANDVVQVGWGATHGASLRANGTVLGWGYNDPAYGQHLPPLGLDSVVELAVGHVHNVALTSGGELYGWGSGYDGQLTPPPLPVISHWAAVVAQGFHTAGVLESGHVLAFGGPESARAASPPDGTNAVAVALGETFLAALRRDGTVAVWSIDGRSALPVPNDLEPAVEIVAGNDRLVTRHASGSVRSWKAATGEAVAVPETATNVVKLAASDQYVVARLADGGLLSWGDGTVPQPLPTAEAPSGVFGGYGRSAVIARLAIEHPPTPTTVAVGDPLSLHVTTSAVLPIRYQWLHQGMPILNATNAWFALPTIAVTNAGHYAVKVWTDEVAIESVPARIDVRSRVHGAVVGWGNPASPVLTQLSAVPPRVRALAGERDHAVALLDDGTVLAWGDPGHGGTSVPTSLKDVVEVAAGYSHYLALHRDGHVTGWGTGDFGQQVVPPGLSNVIQIAAGGLHSLAIQRDGKAIGWGYNAYGQAAVPPLGGLVSIAGAWDRSAAIHGNGTLSEWGQYSGVRPLLLDLVHVVGSGDSMATISAAGDVHVWSAGPGREYPELWPAAKVAIGSSADSQPPHFLALTTTGRVRAAGRNDFGQATVPTWLRNVIAVGANLEASLAVTTLSIRGQSGDVGLLAGAPMALSVDAVGAEPLQYSWRRNGQILPDSTSARFALVLAGPEDSGVYTATVSNGFTELTSASIAVCVLPQDAPLYVWHPLAATGNRLFAAAVKVEPGKSYEIQVSQDLLTWNRLRLIQSTGPVFVLRESTLTTGQARFFRLLSL